jgi:hypothetical protein
VSRPSFQFYHGDWISNAKLRRCTHEEKGAWIDVLCLMADSDEFGIIRWPLQDLAQAIGAKVAVLRTLERKGVLKGADNDAECEPFIYTPRSGRKDGEPVTLIPRQHGPIWYSSKQVRDDYVAHQRAAYARTQGGAVPAPKVGIGDGKGAVLPSPSPSPSPRSTKTSPPNGGSSVWDFGTTLLESQGMEAKTARNFLGSLCRDWDEHTVEEAIRAASTSVEAKAYMLGFLKKKTKKNESGLPRER